MLTARAYSFRRQARLAVSLSWVGGFVNVVAFLECEHLFTSHLTGAVTMLGIDAAEGRWSPALLFLEVCAAFFAGALASSLLAEVARRRRWVSRYVAPVALEAVLLALVGVLLATGVGAPRLVIGLAAFAMGLQNGTITQVSGAVVRSTHITGVVTDLGVELMQAWFWWREPARRVRPANGWRFWRASTWPPRLARLLLLACILASFTVGVVTGALGHRVLPHVVFFVPVAFLLGIVLLDARRPIGEIREVDPLGERDLREHGLLPGAIPAGVGVFWLGRRQPVGAHPDAAARHEAHYHAPDFQAWMERLPDHVRYPVLVLSPHVVLDTDAALDLNHVARRLREGGRRLVLAGLSVGQRALLEEQRVLPVVGTDHVFPEVSQAVAALRERLSTSALDREEFDSLQGL